MKGKEFEWFKRPEYTICGQIELSDFLTPTQRYVSSFIFINIKFMDGDEYTVKLSTGRNLDFIYYENSSIGIVSLYTPDGVIIGVDLDYVANISRVLTALQEEGLYNGMEYDGLYQRYIVPTGKFTGRVAIVPSSSNRRCTDVG